MKIWCTVFGDTTVNSKHVVVSSTLENWGRLALCFDFSKHIQIWAEFFSSLLFFKKSILLFTLTEVTIAFHFFLKHFISLWCLPYATFQSRVSTITKQWHVDSYASGTIYHAAKREKLLTFSKAAGRLQQIPP